ncbi:hypothetical protein F5X99DRAFT_211976 [Biscogniauxia marginata]|nr:hypothetical protein F5X99DRAFT_211976 [Biscogniauxia marginata]
MPSALARNITSALQDLLGPEVANDRLNPVHLVIGTWGHWIQAHILHIPDRFGFFSPGPPRLQVYQGAFVVCVALILGPADLFAAWICLLWKVSGRPVSRLVGGFMAIGMVTIAFIWVAGLLSPRRAPDYNWEDWKLRKEQWLII